MPELEEGSTFAALDLTQAWDAAANDTARRRGESFWDWVTDDGRCLPCPLAGDRSFWDPKTGQPRGRLADFPDAVLLVFVPNSGIHPLQPYEVTEAEVLGCLQQGREVLFVNCRRDYGRVTIENGQLNFATR